MSKIILLELGHTRLKMAAADGTDPFGIQSPEAWPYQQDSLADTLRQHIKLWPAADHIYYASVASASLTALLTQILQEHFATAQITRIETQAQWQGLHNGYRDPKQLGTDRWLHLMAAHHYWPTQASLIISFGTLTTMDYLTPNGEHRGGMILPSLYQLQQSITNVLPQVKLHDDVPAIHLYGTSTQEAALSGVEQLVHDFLSARMTDFLHEYPHGQIILTGGGAEHWITRLTDPVLFQPWLSLIGLALLANHS
jgi:type III pantothenate kinase